MGTAALIIVLSVFNGFESVVISLFSVFDPDIEITVNQGKTFHENEIDAARIRALGSNDRLGVIWVRPLDKDEAEQVKKLMGAS